jgi:hypothetical protein
VVHPQSAIKPSMRIILARRMEAPSGALWMDYAGYIGTWPTEHETVVIRSLPRSAFGEAGRRTSRHAGIVDMRTYSRDRVPACAFTTQSTASSTAPASSS